MNMMPYSQHKALMEELHEIFETMDLPPLRREDYRWLCRNLCVHNGSNPQYDRAMEILNQLLAGEEL